LIFVICCLTVSSAIVVPSASAATAFRVVGQFNVPSSCCLSYLYANDKIFGVGSDDNVYVFSARNNTLIATVPISSNSYLYPIYDSVDNTILLLGQAPCVANTECTEVVSLSTVTLKIKANSTISWSEYYFPFFPPSIVGFAPVAYDSHNDELYIGTQECGSSCQIFVINARTTTQEKTITIPTTVDTGGVAVWSIVYDSKNNNIFASISDGSNDLGAFDGSLVTISDSSNLVTMELSAGQYPNFLGYPYPYYLELDVSNNLLYSYDFGSDGIDVFNASNNGAYVTTIGAQSADVYGAEPANYALDDNLVSGMFYAEGCNAGGLGGAYGGGCPDSLNGSSYSISDTKIGSSISELSSSTNANCLEPFWSGVSKLTYVECGSRLLIFNTSKGTYLQSVNVQGSIAIFNRLRNLLYVVSGNTIYEIGS